MGANSFFRFLIYFTIVILYSGSELLQLQYPEGEWDQIINGEDYSTPLILNENDRNTLIINSTFHDIDGDAIILRNVTNVYIKDCSIYNISGNGIVLSSSAGTSDVTIDSCEIHHIQKNGVISKQSVVRNTDHRRLKIINNLIYEVGNDPLNHGLYIQSQDSIILHNKIHNTGGDGISIRSSGVIADNEIWNTNKSCIRYFSDNLHGESNSLEIENNVCFLEYPGRHSPGVSLLWWKDVQPEWVVTNYIIRFNTIVVFTDNREGISIESSEFANRHVEVYGNLIVNTHDASKSINEKYIDILSSNFVTSSLVGFAQVKTKPYDFHITKISPAVNFANGVVDYPENDIDGIPRRAGEIDAGAFQYIREEPSVFSEQLAPGFILGIGVIVILVSIGILLYLRDNRINSSPTTSRLFRLLFFDLDR